MLAGTEAGARPITAIVKGSVAGDAMLYERPPVVPAAVFGKIVGPIAPSNGVLLTATIADPIEPLIRLMTFFCPDTAMPEKKHPFAAGCDGSNPGNRSPG